MTRLRLRGIAVSGVATLAFGGGAALAATPTTLWSAGAQLTLPAGASATPTGTALPGLSCTGIGACSAIGAFTNGSGQTQSMGLNETNGAWGQATAIPLASGTGVTSSSLNALSCASAGVCVAVGSADIGGTTTPIVDSQAAGTWSQPITLPSTLPSGATNAALNGVSCNGANNCTAVGSDDNAGQTQAMVATDTGGTWAAATQLTLPGGAVTTGQKAVVNAVSCTSPGNCIAVGSYIASTGTEGMIASEVGGTWSPAATADLPANAAASGQNATLNAIACQGTACMSVGSYVDSSGQTQALYVPVNGGTIGVAGELALPAGAATAGQHAALDSVSCAGGAGNCIATGSYLAGATGAPMAATQSGGAWTAATALAEPSDAVATADPSAIALAVGCNATVRCSAVGSYPVGAGVAPMALASHGSLSITNGATLPAGAAAKHYQVQLDTAGGTGGNVWSVISGALPAGLALNASTGVISGTPTTNQTATFGVAVTDNASPPDRATATFTVQIGPSTKPPKTTTKKKKSGSSKLKAGIHVGHIKVVHGTMLHVQLKCVRRRHCTGRLAVVAYEHLRGRRIVSITSTLPRHHHGKVRKVTLMTLRYSVRGGHPSTHKLRLNRFGRRLVAQQKRLKVSLQVRPSGHKRYTTVRKTLKLHQPPAKHAKKGAHKGHTHKHHGGTGTHRTR